MRHPEGADRVLLDVTRLIALRWTGRQFTGIDRVCAAYLQHFRARACAVVQHRGVIRVLTKRQSDRLFDVLETPPPDLRARLVALLSAALAGASRRPPQRDMAYLNVGDTDFDLAAHRAWTRRHDVRPFYFIHDLIPALHPEFSRPHAIARHRGRVESALTTGAGIMLGSRAVARDLADFAQATGLPLPPLVVAPIAGAPLPAVDSLPPMGTPPFFLAIATVEPRKNHRLLLDVWRMLEERLGADTPRLVLAGQTGPMTGDLLAPLATDPVLRRHIELRTTCTDAELAGLLRAARALLVPSLAEGFGLPVVEALAAGTPVIASDIPVFREIAQGAARLLDPYKPQVWADAIASAALCGQSGAIAERTPVKDFSPPLWSDHFALVERFIATRMPCRESLTERVLAA